MTVCVETKEKNMQRTSVMTDELLVKATMFEGDFQSKGRFRKVLGQ